MLQESILQYFRPSLSYHLSLRPNVLSIFEWPFKTGFTVPQIYIKKHTTNSLNKDGPIVLTCNRIMIESNLQPRDSHYRLEDFFLAEFLIS